MWLGCGRRWTGRIWLLAVWSEAYFQSPFSGAELRAAFVRQVHEAGRVVPVLVESATVPELYASLIYVDLVGLDEAAAAERLRGRHIQVSEFSGIVRQFEVFVEHFVSILNELVIILKSLLSGHIRLVI